MKLYPAIDLRNGQVVRLTQGDYDKMTVYGTDPCAQARQFVAAGAKYLHVVDLDGAKDGTLSNYDTIAALAKQGGLYIEVGGGIRTEERIEKYLSLGVGRCILGSVAVTDFEFTARMLQKYGDQIAVGVDAKDGFVAIHGWKEVSAEKGVDFCKRLAAAGCKAIIYTDIACDGAMQGTNLAQDGGRHPHPLQLQQLCLRGNAAAGRELHPRHLGRELAVEGQIGALHGTVAGNIRVDDGF